MINKLIEENKPENMEIVTDIMKVCDTQTNGDFLSNLKPKSIQFYNSVRDEWFLDNFHFFFLPLLYKFRYW